MIIGVIMNLRLIINSIAKCELIYIRILPLVPLVNPCSIAKTDPRASSSLCGRYGLLTQASLDSVWFPSLRSNGPVMLATFGCSLPLAALLALLIEQVTCSSRLLACLLLKTAC